MLVLLRLAKMPYLIIRDIFRLRNIDTLVYSVGKVGSRSFCDNKKTFHVHTLSGTSNKYFSVSYDSKLSVSEFLSEYFYWNIIGYFIKLKIKKRSINKIIVPIREPIIRNISSYFQTTKVKKNNFCHVEFYHDVNPLVINNWFENEIFRIVDVKIEDFDVNKNNPFFSFNVSGIDIFIIKLERLDECKDILMQSIGIDAISHVNKRGDQEYAGSYSEFKDGLELSEDYLNFIYTNTYLRFFYSSNEIEVFKKYWLKK